MFNMLNLDIYVFKIPTTHANHSCCYDCLPSQKHNSQAHAANKTFIIKDQISEYFFANN